jgi:polyhydroxyalkanoate synthesis regulator phasin
VIETIQKALYTGIGMAVLTKDRVEELAKDLVDQAKLSEKEGQNLLGDLKAQAEKVQTEFEKRVEDLVKKTIDKLGLVTKEELARAVAEVKEHHSAASHPRTHQ